MFSNINVIYVQFNVRLIKDQLKFRSNVSPGLLTQFAEISLEFASITSSTNSQSQSTASHLPFLVSLEEILSRIRQPRSSDRTVSNRAPICPRVSQLDHCIYRLMTFPR